MNSTSKPAWRQSSEQTILLPDAKLLACVLILLALGMLMVTSASTSISEREVGAAFFYSIKHMISIVLGIVAGTIAFCIPLHQWQRWSFLLWISGLLLLVAVLIPGVGVVFNGSRRWINLGIMTFQASEWMKLVFVLFLAHWITLHRASLIQVQWFFLRALAMLALVMGLLLLEPDFGAATVIMMTVGAMLFISGVPLKPYLGLASLAGIGMAALALAAPYRLARITAFIDPWADQFDTGYQLTQALIAFGRGEWFGVGIGSSIQKLFYLPEAFSDFLFAIIAEETGLMGGLMLLSLYGFLGWQGFSIVKKAQKSGDEYAALVAFGLSFWLIFQALINIGVNTGLLPTKGLTLPLMSAGGSSILINCIAVGILLRIQAQYKASTKKTRRRYFNTA